MQAFDRYFMESNTSEIHFDSGITVTYAKSTVSAIDIYASWSRDSTDAATNPLTYKFQLNEIDELRLSVSPSAVIGYLIALIICGIVGNGGVVFLIASNRKFHRAPFYFILQVSMINLSKTVFSLPFALSVMYNDFQWIYSKKACSVSAFFNTFFPLATSIGLLTAVIERYMSMTSPRFHNKCSRGFVILFVIILGWSIAFCLSFPPIFKADVYKFIRTELQCTFVHKPYRDNDTLGYTILFTCLLHLALLIHWRFFRFLRSHRRMVPLHHEAATSPNWNFLGPGANRQALINLLNGFSGGPPTAFANAAQTFQHFGRVVHLRPLRNEHLTRVLFIYSLIFVVIWMPYLFQIFVRVFVGQTSLSIKFIIISTMLSHCHIVMCPLIYLCVPNPLSKTIFERFKTLRKGICVCTLAEEQQNDGTVPESMSCIELEV